MGRSNLGSEELTLANNGKITVTCPNCGSTGTYTTTNKSGDGNERKKCNSCRKDIRIKLRKGDVDSVTK